MVLSQGTCKGQECFDSLSDGNVLLQKKTSVVRTPLDQGVSDDLAAQFLIQATFGPTRESMEIAKGRSHMTWIKEQMSSKVESHREYYRSHVSSHFDTFNVDVKAFVEKPACSKGSRW